MGYLNRDKILSYNAILNFIVLKRGYGKTYTFKTMVIDAFIKNGSQTVWLRRYKEELKEAKDKFLGDIINKYPKHKFSFSGNYLLIDDKKAIYFTTLTKAQYIKSSAMPLVEYLIFDEFIIEGNASKYIPNECVSFCSILSSVFRDRKIRAFLLGNKDNVINPYSIYFNLPDFNGVTYVKDRRILVYASDNDDVIENNYAKSDLLTVLQGTTYYSYSLKNESLSNSSTFIEKRPSKLECSFALDINGIKIGVFFDSYNSKIYFDDNYDKTIKASFCIDSTNISKSFFLLNKQNPIYKMLKQALQYGRIYYVSPRVQSICVPLIKFLQ